MRLSDSYLWRTVYLGTSRPDDIKAIDVKGTGFLLLHEGCTYIVSAAHVVVPLDDGPIAIRLNRTDTGLGDIDHLDQAKWHYHPDPAVDIAVLPYSPPPWAKVNYAKSKAIASEFKIESKGFGPGDLAYVVGIFQKMRGKEKNMPVVHVGHVGSMGVGEKFLTDDWRPGKGGRDIEVSGYVIQVSTLPESSGSPVYVRRTLDGWAPEPKYQMPPGVRPGDKVEVPLVLASTYGSVWLLGVWHGMWKTADQGVIVGTNTGVCTPAPRILETLALPELVEMRRTANNAGS